MDQVLPYPPSQSRLMCAVASQGLLSSSPQATFGAPGIGLPQGSLLNSYTFASARAVAPQPKNFISNPTPHSFPPAVEPPMTHRSSLPASYNAAPSLFPSPTGAISLNPVQQYHPLYASYNACLPSTVTVAPFNQPTSFAPVPPINYHQENFTSDDPSSTTVFVAGLPTCITEETLKTFFQNFGEIAYVKIPPHKGYGFVKYVRREDAKQAIIKMNDFPIHENSRIRLSWGRSLGDKKVEYVKKLSSALSISFESVWKIVQGQDPATIKQIASTVCGRNIGQTHEPPKLPPMNGLDQQHQTARFSNFGSIPQNHATALNSFPSVLATHITTSPIPLHPKSTFPDLSGGNIRSSNPHHLNRHGPISEIKDIYHHRPASSCQIEPSSACTSRPKALSQGSGSSALPPPSWTMRNSWEEPLQKDKFSQTLESPVSSINEIRLSEVSPCRRATIPSVMPPSMHEHIPLSQRHQLKSPGSAILSSSQASSSMDSFEAPTLGLRHVPGDKIPLVKERDEYQLGCNGFLHELLEEEAREDVTFDHSRSNIYQAPRQPNFTGEPSFQDLFPWGPPSSGTESRKFSQNDNSDWPRTFLGSGPTCESEAVKSIFNSTLSIPPHLDRARQAGNCESESSLGHLNTCSFPSLASDSSHGSNSELTVPSISDSKVAISIAADTGIKSLDNFWTLSL